MLSSVVSQSGTIIKKTPSKLIEDQLSGRSLSDIHRNPEIIQFLNIADCSNYPNTNVPLEEPLFQPEPTVIQFANYEPLDTKEVILHLRNKDQVSRRVKLIPPDSRLFTIVRSKADSQSNKGTKVAPGMVTDFIIQFTPEAKVDYSYDLVVVTEREKFVVPIRCLGQRAMISFPDVVNFSVCPVKHVTERPFVIRNVGEKASKWVLKMQPPFNAEKTEGFLEVGQVDQVIMKFFAQESRAYEEEMVLSYDTLEAYVKIIAEAQNDPNVYLSKTFIDLKKAYITLSSQDSLKIINKSDVPVEFEWRAFANDREEYDKKTKLILQLSQEEAEERMMIEENLEIEDEVESLDSDDSYDDLENKNLKERKLQIALATLERKYMNIRKAVEDDLMLFQDDIFKIEPQKGKIWPNGELEITVMFCPQSALHYTCTAYCNVTCSEERLPLTLEAIGIGPEALLSTSEYDIGDVFVNDMKDIPHIFIENQGAIEAKYTILQSDTPFGSKFKFEQYEGTLGTSEYNRKQPLKIKFCSDLMGEFSETFRIQLVGSSEELSLTLKGHVMPPSFKFDKDEINFGEVSYQFPYSDIIRIQNTSRVAFTYHIRVPGDASALKKEFDIIPNSGYLKPREIHNIQIDFMPMTVKKYDLVLVVDIEGVGPDMHTLPIKAECFVPKVELIPSDTIDFKNVFLRHPYEDKLELKNRSKLQAKFEMIPQDEQSTLIAAFTPDREEGFIDPKSSTIVKITIFPQKAGLIRIPMHVKVLGDNQQPHMITLVANCTGPIVEVLTPELDFGKVKVLEKYPLQATLHNKSDIEAEYHAFTKNKGSVFSVVEKEGNLKPGEVRDLTVMCCADECISFNEILYIVVKEGEDVEIVLKAKGTGTTAYCDDDIKIIDFGTVFSCRNHVKRYTIQNKGRKPQRLKWNRENQRGVLVPVVENQNKQTYRGTTANNTTGVSVTKEKDAKDAYIFNVTPVTIFLQPKTQISFEFTANSAMAGDLSEKLICTSLVGNERKDRVIYECELKGKFIEPFLQFSEPVLHFRYVWEKGVQIEPLSKMLEITCASLLPANFLLKCSPPFNISKEKFSLEPGQTESLRVDFDPGHKYDKKSGKAVQKLQIIHQDHPQKDNIELIGEVCFPNVKFEALAVDFGCILNDTSKKVYMKMTNDSILPVNYDWVFVEEIPMEENRFILEDPNGDASTESSVNQYFDILPVMGHLEPGESETVEFTYHSQLGKKHVAQAMCTVEGGPEYYIPLVGESSNVGYQLSRYSIDFGNVPFNESSPQEFFIENPGKVSFEYSISLEKLTRPGVVEVMPSQGKVAAGEKAKITVKVTPGIPDTVEELLQIEVAHFEPLLFKISALGIYPALLFHLPRPDNALHDELIEQVKSKRNITNMSFDSVLQTSKNESKAGKAVKFEQIVIDVEAEADRIFVCQKLTKIIDEYYSKTLKRKTTSMTDEGKSLCTALAEVHDKVTGAVWECNFGNMVLGKDKTKWIRMTNIGQLPVTFNFDVKFLKFNGLAIEPAKVNRLEAGESVNFKITFQSNKKTMQFGPIKTVTTVQLKNGLSYQLSFKANLTIPDFNVSSDSIDFGRVIIGTLSIAKIRFENIREVPCEWAYAPKHPSAAAGAPPDWERFTINPPSGMLQPNQKCTIDVTFTPTQEKAINQKLEFKINNNQVNKVLTLKGNGVGQTLEFIPNKVVLGPVLTYSKDAWSLVEMKNPTDYPIEVFSLDFDGQFKEEEEIMRNFEGFEQGAEEMTSSLTVSEAGPRKDSKPLYLVPRKPGMPVWREMALSYERKQRKLQQAQKDKEMDEKLKSEKEEDRKMAEEYFKKRSEEAEETKIEEKFPGYIPENDRHNVIVWGRPGKGKSFLAQHLAQKHGRVLISPNSVIEWHLMQGGSQAEEIQKYLDEMKIKKEKDIQDREKARKGRRKVEEVPFDEKIYNHLPLEMLEKLVDERLRYGDCNAGVVIDDLRCDYYPNSLFGAHLFAKAFQEQNIQLIIIDTDTEHRIESQSIVIEDPETDTFHFREPDPKETELFNKEKEEVRSAFQSYMVAKDTEENPEELSRTGSIFVNEIGSSTSKARLLATAFEIVPFPVFPDPESLPLPPPQILQIVYKPRQRHKRAAVNGFSIYTPINQTPLPSEIKEGEEPVIKLDVKDENLDKTKARWIVDAHCSTYLLVKFFSKEVGNYENTLQFEIMGGLKHFNLPCSCSCQFPIINADPRNVFLKRKKSRPTAIPDCYISKCYIMSENRFDFGPLLIGKNPDKKNEEAIKRTNCESFRITNNGLYQVKVDYALASSIGDTKSVFVFDPESMTLECDETKDLNVWAFPNTIGEFSDSLVALIQGNPTPVIFPLVCQGEKPTAEVDPELISFERILLTQNIVKSFTVKNICKISLKWSLSGIDALPQEFQVDKKEGILKPQETATVTITFTAIKQQKFQALKVILEVEDVEKIGVKQEQKPILIEAEAFDVKAKVDFGPGNNIINFGNVRVFEEAQRGFNLVNEGIYEIKYNFIMKKKQTREMFGCSPVEGSILPNQTQAILVNFKTDKERKIEPAKEESGIKLAILEGGSGQKYEEFPINVAVNAVFSKYSIHPLRNINFGPLRYGENRSRTFEVKNEGIFDFEFSITELIDERQRAIERAARKSTPKEETKGKGKEEAKKKQAEKKPAKGKEVVVSTDIGPFNISPSQGTVYKNSSVLINVTFNADGSRLYEKTLAINISNRDPTDNPQGIPYVLAGESCIPGVNTWDFDAIFEEQTVVQSLELAKGANPGTLMPSKIFSIEENVFLYGTYTSSKNHEGIIEKFKIMNAAKVPANITFSVKPRTTSKSEGFAFEVVPLKVHIPPHSHEYVKVTFKPTDMLSYGGIFEGVVEFGEPNPKTHKLTFELRGEGTLPTVTQINPLLAEDGKSLVKFTKTRVGKTSKALINLMNGGVIPATVKVEMEYHKNFKFQDTMSATLQPKTSMSFEVFYTPDVVQKATHELRITTLSNPYESQLYSLIGEGYQEDVMFTHLPDDKEDECNFGDCIVGQEKYLTFHLHNFTDKIIKFEWPERPHFFFSPSIGHLAPKSSKKITLTFKADETQEYKNLDLICQTVQINQISGHFEDWDNSMCDTKMVTQKQYEKIMKRKEEEEKRKKEEYEASLKKGAKKPVAAAKKKEEKKSEVIEEEVDDGEANIEINEVRKEPAFAEVDKTMKQVPLKVTAVADYIRYNCDYQEIRFASTLMFASRSFKLPLKNIAKISMPYRFKICSATTGKLDAGPYSVSPREGIIAPGCIEFINVKFSPSEIESMNERLLICSLNNLSPDLKPLVIELKGKSIRPICHFELPPSTYREKKAQDMAPVDNSYQILDFESMGTKVKNTKRFYVVNPTSQGYEFVWEPEEVEGSEFSLKQFSCVTPKGVILSGKKFEMAFEYTPETVGTHESYWKFRIPGEKITQKFLIVGTVLEPHVSLERGMIDFNQLLIGGKAKETIQLINEEIIPFIFSFDRDSIKGEESYGDSLVVSPINGEIPPQGSIPIEITFRPKRETRFNYNLVCNVKRKARQLVLNVKGVGYVISHSVHYENSRALLVEEPCEVNFGDIFINECQSRAVKITNSGKFNFDFSWKMPNASRYVAISPEQGTVKSGESVNIYLKYAPLAEHKLSKAKFQLSIVSGPIYSFICKGSARKPGVQFSFIEKDFGPCFVLRTLLTKTANLEIVNYDNTAISVETNFERLPHLDVQLAPGQVLLPTSPTDPELEKKKLIVPILFTPRDHVVYQENIEFDINNIHKIQVKVKGEGCPVKLELGSRDQEIVDFGVSRAGVEKTKTVQLVNKSKRSVNFTLIDGSGLDSLKKHSVTYTPDKEVILKPKQALPIEIGFKPKERLHPFTDDLLVKFDNGETRKLLTISGACHGIELKLMEEVVSFGVVIQGSHQSKAIQLLNIGDIPCHFQWDSAKYSEHFTITPDQGIIQANAELYFDITFHPAFISPDIRINKIPCNIQGSDPIFLTLHGSCIPPTPESTKDLRFEAIVRESQTQKVQVKNPTTAKWRIQPSISTNSDFTKKYWTCANALEINPNAVADFEVSYKPITMTTPENLHQATLFFPLPDGTALLFNLIGTSKPPRPVDTVVQEIKAKVAKILILPVKNWLEIVQRFEVKWDIEGEMDPAVLIRGASTFDVPAYSTKEYKLNFLTYKTGVTKFKITFTNPANKEYIFFNIEMKALQQEQQGVVELVSPVREVTQKVIMIANPLESPIEITRAMIVCDNEYVTIEPEWLEIPPKSESGIEVIYRPLIVAELQSKLSVKSTQLGEFNYILQLKGLPNTTHRNLHFATSLGTELVQAFRFQHFLKKQVQYQIKLEKINGTGPADFLVDKPVIDAPICNNWDGIEISLPVRYEPSTLGESRAMMTVIHPEGGEYTCLLFGHSSSPMPQGPFKCIPAKGTGIDFRNPFYEPMEYTIRIDNPAFTISTKSPVRLDSKKSISIQVVYKPQEGKPPTGRMIITAGDLPPWIYYLSGE